MSLSKPKSDHVTPPVNTHDFPFTPPRVQSGSWFRRPHVLRSPLSSALISSHLCPYSLCSSQMGLFCSLDMNHVRPFQDLCVHRSLHLGCSSSSRSSRQWMYMFLSRGLQESTADWGHVLRTHTCPMRLERTPMPAFNTFSFQREQSQLMTAPEKEELSFF